MNDPSFTWKQWALVTLVGAVLTTVGTKVAEWAIEEIREAAGRPPKNLAARKDDEQ